MRRITELPLGLLLLAGVCSLAGCPDNPYKASSWTKKLGTREHDRAVQELEQLGDPAAIPDIGKAWDEGGRHGRDLQAIIALARPLTKAEAEAKFYTDYIETGREASWDKALPFLKKALTAVEESNAASVESAAKAADAIGESKLGDGMEALIELASKEPSKKLFTAQVAAIRALGRFDDSGDRTKAQAAVVKIIDREPPPHPRTVKGANQQETKEQKRAAEEKYGIFLGVTGAAINALGELRINTASKTLILALYRMPELATQIRRALVSTGPSAKDELRKVITGQNKEVEELFARKSKVYPRGMSWYCGDTGELPPDKCAEVSLKDFYAAMILGDFYDAKTAPELLGVLKKPAQPFAFIDDSPSPATQYSAVFDSLRKIGPAEAAAAVRGMWMVNDKPGKRPAGDEPDLRTRILAIGAYAFLSRDQVGVKELGDIAADNKADAELRQAAAEAFARLSRNPNEIRILEELAAKYYKASDEKRKEADGKPKKDSEAADKVFADEKKKLDEAKANVLRTSKDPTKSAKDIKQATDDAKKVEAAFKDAKKKHREATQPYRLLDDAAKRFFGYGRLFQFHMARIEIAIRCKDDLECYSKALTLKPEECAKNLKSYIKDVDKWDKNDQLALLEGNVERAMLEIGKRGQAASKYSDLLLDNAKSDNRIIRQSILLALPKITSIPCAPCAAKLDAAIKAGEGKSTIAELNLETTMLRNYFSAGQRMGDKQAEKSDKSDK